MGRRWALLLALLSAAVAAAPAAAKVVINEIMYNSAGSPDVEYVELFNTGPGPQNLAGWYLLDDDDLHPKCMLAGTLGAGQYLVVAGLLPLFGSTYPGVTNVNPNPFDSAVAGAGFGLGNGTDQVRLFDAGGAQVDVVTYTDTPPWPIAADGGGPSLELRNPLLDNADPASWSASVNPLPPGTPGAQNGTFDPDLPPEIADVTRAPALPAAVDAVTVAADVSDDADLDTVTLFVDGGAGFAAQPMFDDGLHGDGVAADSTWGATIAPRPHGALVRYYLVALDGLGQATTFPAGAPGADYLAYTVGHVPPYVRLTEIVASNVAGAADEFGQHEDWIELHNPGPDAVDLTAMFLSDDPDQPTRWPLPSLALAPDERVVVWCDEDPFQGPLHASFKLARERGFVGLYDTRDHGNTLLHGWSYGPQNPDVSFGFRPDDADAPEYLVPPTPGSTNAGSAPLSPVCINEFLATSALGAPDWIEVHNRGPLTADVSGWHLSDDAAVPAKHTFPAGTTIPAGGFLTVSELGLGFALAASGSEELVLTAPDAVGGRDYFDFGPQIADISQGRFANGMSNWEFFAGPSPTQPNACAPGAPQPGPVSGLRFDTKTALAWNAAAGAAGHDVVRGDLIALRATGGDFSAAIGGCLADDRPDARAFEGATPAPGAGWFYVARGVNGFCGFGTYDANSPHQAQPRDAPIAASGAACP